MPNRDSSVSMRTKAIICDLDGTLYNSKERQDLYLRNGKKNFDEFHQAAHKDKPHFWCAELIQSMRAAGYRTVFTSGRDDCHEESTRVWIKRHLNWGDADYDLIMRKTYDWTADDEMKKDWYEKLIEPHYEILFAIDDRKRVVDMWRSLGLTCLHCDVGDF